MARKAAGGRRTKGTGSVYQLPNGKYIGQARILGKRMSTPVCKTEREAEKLLRQMLADAEKGIIIPTGKLTLTQWFDRWLADIAPQKVRPETHKTYSMLVRVHLKPTLGHLKLIELQRTHLRSFYSGLSAKGLAASTIHRIHAVLSSSLEDAVKDDLIPRNAARGMELPSIQRAEIHTLDTQQARQLLTAARASRYEALWKLLLFGGLRIGEALALQWRSVDLHSGTVAITHTLTRSKTLGPPKTGTGRRTISIPPVCVEALKAQKAQQAQERLAASEWASLDLVFCTGTAGHCKTGKTVAGSPLTERVVTRAFESLLQRAELPRVRLHSLRHAAATFMIQQAGIPIKTVSARLGHAKVSTTLDLYTHALPAQDREAADRVAALLA